MQLYLVAKRRRDDFMKVTLKNKKYTFLIGYQKENKYRVALNTLVEKIYSFSFEAWYKSGYWNEKYIPYTLYYLMRIK